MAHSERTQTVRSERSRASGEVEEQAGRGSGGLRLRCATLRPNGKDRQRVRKCTNLLRSDLGFRESITRIALPIFVGDKGDYYEIEDGLPQSLELLNRRAPLTDRGSLEGGVPYKNSLERAQRGVRWFA